MCLAYQFCFENATVDAHNNDDGIQLSDKRNTNWQFVYRKQNLYRQKPFNKYSWRGNVFYMDEHRLHSRKSVTTTVPIRRSTPSLENWNFHSGSLFIMYKRKHFSKHDSEGLKKGWSCVWKVLHFRKKNQKKILTRRMLGS